MSSLWALGAVGLLAAASELTGKGSLNVAKLMQYYTSLIESDYPRALTDAEIDKMGRLRDGYPQKNYVPAYLPAQELAITAYGDDLEKINQVRLQLLDAGRAAERDYRRKERLGFYWLSNAMTSAGRSALKPVLLYQGAAKYLSVYLAAKGYWRGGRSAPLLGAKTKSEAKRFGITMAKVGSKNSRTDKLVQYYKSLIEDEVVPSTRQLSALHQRAEKPPSWEAAYQLTVSTEDPKLWESVKRRLIDEKQLAQIKEKQARLNMRARRVSDVQWWRKKQKLYRKYKLRYGQAAYALSKLTMWGSPAKISCPQLVGVMTASERRSLGIEPLYRRVRKMIKEGSCPVKPKGGGGGVYGGYCAVAAGAMYFSLGGQKEWSSTKRFCTYTAKLPGDSVGHWFLAFDGKIIDPTGDQFSSAKRKEYYAAAKAKGFSTRKNGKKFQPPSKDQKKFIDALNFDATEAIARMKAS